MTWREISAEELNKLKDRVIVDVRSPCEHEKENIPDSHNVPLLSDEERAVVGTIYKKKGEATARKEALKLIAPKIPPLIDEILSHADHGKSIVVHCWRGGLRSEAVASFLSVIGTDCWRLTGGYKAWRRQVLNDFEVNQYQFQPVILQGLTGVGKTEILRELKALSLKVLDLEGLANHRGSVFGGMGLGEQPTQKNFDAALWTQLRELGPGPVFMEAESRKIGKLSLPDCIYSRIQSGRRILVTGTLEARGRRIVDDYAPHLTAETQAAFIARLPVIRERIGTKRTGEIREMAENGNVAEAVESLLLEYYDPLYKRHIESQSPFELEVSGDDPAQAARSIQSWMEQSVRKKADSVAPAVDS